MKRIFLLIFLLYIHCGSAKEKPGYDPNYRFLRSGSLIEDKEFYLLTVISNDQQVRKLLTSNNILSDFYRTRRAMIASCNGDTIRSPRNLLNKFRYSAENSAMIKETLAKLYEDNKAIFDNLINKHLRPSGYYQRFAGENNKALLLKAWEQVVSGSNYIIDQFGLGVKLRYPAIDSATFYVNSDHFRYLIKEMISSINKNGGDSLFFDPTLKIALKLMEINERDEPARNEPLDNGINKAAFEKIKTTDWGTYPYSAILVLGFGPERQGEPLSPIGKARCDSAAIRYKNNRAPFVIVSGGYVAPFRTPYCEAIEMKKYLETEYSIPESAIIAEPFSRHTTTNIRNTNRLIYRYGMPPNKPVLIVSSPSHIDMIAGSAAFNLRNKFELGYLPYSKMTRRSGCEAEYYPSILSLHMDPGDPLDP